jgi:hypothetical protein
LEGTAKEVQDRLLVVDHQEGGHDRPQRMRVRARC